MRLAGKLVVLLSIFVVLGCTMNASSDIASLPSLGISSLMSNYSQSSDQALNSDATHFANTNDSNVFAYPSVSVGGVAPSLSFLPSFSNALLPTLGSVNSLSFDKASTDLDKINKQFFIPMPGAASVLSPSETSVTPVVSGFPILAHSSGSTVFNQESTNTVDKESLNLNSIIPTPTPTPTTTPTPTPTPRPPKRMYVVLIGNDTNPSNTVLVFDPVTNNLVNNITVGTNPQSVVFNPSGTRAYVTNAIDNTVSVINTFTETVIATVPVGLAPIGIAMAPSGNQVYVANFGDTTVSVIDTATNLNIKNIPGLNGPEFLTVNPSGTLVYATNTGNNSISIIDTTTLSVVNTISTGDNQPRGIAFTPNGAKFYVANRHQGNVSVFNGVTNAIITNITVEAPNNLVGPLTVAINPSGTLVYVTERFGTHVFVIDTATDTLSTSIVTGLDPIGVAFTSDGARAYVTNIDGETIAIIDVATSTVTGQITNDINGRNPQGIAINPDP